MPRILQMALEIARNCWKSIEVELGIGQLEFSGYILEHVIFPKFNNEKSFPKVSHVLKVNAWLLVVCEPWIIIQ
jgi:hypothetical protein